MNPSSEAPAKNPDWQKRYLDSLDSLERERQQFRALEAVLKKLIGRLGSASQGQSQPLDDQLRKLQTALRGELATQEIEKITSALTDAIAKLDSPVAPRLAGDAPAKPEPPPRLEPPRPEPLAAIAADTGALVGAPLRGTLSVLLTEIRNDPALTLLADELDPKLSATLTRDALPDLMSSICTLVAQRIQNLERSKQGVERLLGLMVGKLDDISRFVADHSQDQSQSMINRETLSTQLVGAMKAIGESVDAEVDLQQIRTQVRGRLDSIGRHLKQFRERESARFNEMRARNEQMQTRVAQLEAEASKLQHQLSDEQRLSTIDGLTNIPNRLAYEKRMQEELQRWQRFQQPTCIAVWDIDRFKRINDEHGHGAGDRVLKAVADCLAGRVRRTDFLARFGGEEFVMILCGTDPDSAIRLIETMRTAISEVKFHTSGTPLPPVTISIGVTALLPNDTIGTAFDRADKALYQAKNAGRNRCVRG